MKISCIITVLNEEGTVEKLLQALTTQSLLPDEIILTDGGSTDNTVGQITAFNNETNVQIILTEQKGNRAVGRNAAIERATGEIIVCTDAGCFPEKHWIEEITKPFTDPEVDVVAGYYESKSETIFQDCLVPYVFVMPDRLDSRKFLPASRSMAFTKAIWEKAGRFPEQYSHNEDYVFAHTLKNMGAKIVFHKQAIVYWIPRNSLPEAYQMFYRFALGDMESGIHRPKVFLVFARYLLGLILIATSIFFHSILLFAACCLLLVGYIVWAILKNYRYIDEPQALYMLPALQFTADAAVLVGSTEGFFKHGI